MVRERLCSERLHGVGDEIPVWSVSLCIYVSLHKTSLTLIAEMLPKPPRPPSKSTKAPVASLVEQTEGMSIDEIEDPDESVIVRPSRKTRASGASSGVLSAGSQSGEVKKKKR